MDVSLFFTLATSLVDFTLTFKILLLKRLIAILHQPVAQFLSPLQLFIFIAYISVDLKKSMHVVYSLIKWSTRNFFG